MTEGERYVSVREAGQLFPRPLSVQAVRHRITRGIEGTKLEAEYDGHQYWIRPQAVSQFLLNLASKRKNRTKELSKAVVARESRARKLYEQYFM